jgi:ribonuclease PH
MLIRQFARHEHAIREVSFISHVSPSADGSCVIKSGNTHILCTACLDMNATGLHVEFGQLPGSEHPRRPRNDTRHTFESQSIENTVHQSLSLMLDGDVLSKVGLFIDCDVLQSEGSLKTACVSGGYVAMALALKKWTGSTLFPKMPLIGQVAGISCGFIKGRMVLDLDHQEAVQADVVGDFVFSSDHQVVAVDVRAKQYAVPFEQVRDMENMAVRGVAEILSAQKQCLNA